jgi:hypothetical protein
MAMTDPDEFHVVAPAWWVANFGGMVMSGLIASRSRSKLVRMGFTLAVVTHIAEAGYAYHAARRAGFTSSANKWFLQTLAVGFPSLIALHAAKEADADTWG